ncbi:hypothetical protein [Streptomyces sp. MI02-7b]|uniref:hypothetical protein n=1 Tax=Streptomyces sp. MI02-7b TaxID=462941 RepID=UPI0029A63BA0|nr:hypothetical protein [Streptomyces sp. MI02-7b]MDX3071465.1 hypothetical protein [Streptomyces sp. MI02-7b]
MPVDIYAALGALVRAEATRDQERRPEAPDSAPAPAAGDAPDGPRTADAGAPKAQEDPGVGED